ncbi:RNA polymerase sigma factor [Aegicerativicinus sediminis]|uniref:RNA polymerase sigma factor n=1 Tax=Aegicerativicinus sediminis TaxID=2893202 RepID=UPI001E5D71BA|nr:sigma-70 family RNA polymerase sigma factor [Aegicerativicinus sediminis]
MSLEKLIIDCKKNNAKAQGELYKIYSSKLFSLCLKYSRNKAEAEDNLHDAFVTIFNKIGQYNGQGSFEGWMKRITINTALQKYRTAGVYDIVNEEALESAEEEIEDEDLPLQFLIQIIQELPDRYRLVFNLYVLDGYSHNEISEMVGISVGGSKSNLARARMILREKIENFRTSEQKQSL